MQPYAQKLITPPGSTSHTTAEVAALAGVHKDTLLRWLRMGAVPEPSRDRRGWRCFTLEQARDVVSFARGADPSSTSQPPELAALDAIDWNFTNAKTSYLTHGIHPYPAKFIPQIPNSLIQELSSVGDTVGDIFCGSGTTVVEALTLKRNAVGIDANPLACLITNAKIAEVDDSDIALLLDLALRARELSDGLRSKMESDLFPLDGFSSSAWKPDAANLLFWFAPYVAEELAELLEWCKQLKSESARTIALTAFSSIVVAVSKQDSDTRYVRREKSIGPGDTARRFARALESSISASREFTDIKEERFSARIVQSSLLDAPDVPTMDLMVCSPPYPNAFSYHLYHMTRMLWLGMDQPRFKKAEIGSHRKYSSKGRNAATVETFRAEFTEIMNWLSGKLKPRGYACFIVGDSTLRGVRINNADIISECGALAGFQEVHRIERTLQSTKKSFNPSLGRIKTEAVLIMQNLNSNG